GIHRAGGAPAGGEPAVRAAAGLPRAARRRGLPGAASPRSFPAAGRGRLREYRRPASADLPARPAAADKWVRRRCPDSDGGAPPGGRTDTGAPAIRGSRSARTDWPATAATGAAPPGRFGLLPGGPIEGVRPAG